MNELQLTFSSRSCIRIAFFASICFFVAFPGATCQSQDAKKFTVPFSRDDIASTRKQLKKQGWALNVESDVGIKFVLIPPGEFEMGEKESGRKEEFPHIVEISNPYYMAVTEVTQKQWQSVMGSNPSTYSMESDDEKIRSYVNKLDVNQLPVDCVHWTKATKFVKKLNKEHAIKGFKFQLPTEAQWEFACRSGSEKKYSFGDTIEGERHARFEDTDYHEGPAEVGSFKPNQFGLFDMHGNVFEWCSDYYSKEYFKQSPSIDPKGPAKPDKQKFLGYYSKVLRGGSWISGSKQCRSAFRTGASWAEGEFGVRVILVKEK
ncbi:MAG: formylglycine-generating enzyme family protein [Planctomycetota bacterium]